MMALSKIYSNIMEVWRWNTVSNKYTLQYLKLINLKSNHLSTMTHYLDKTQ